MKWTTKARIQRSLSRLPAGKTIYYFGQRFAGGLRCFKIDDKVEQTIRLVQGLNAVGIGIEGQSTVEIGTGWFPVIPLIFWLNGHKECHTYDVAPLLKDSLVIEAAKQLESLSRIKDLKFSESCSRKMFNDRLHLLRRMIQHRATGCELLQQCQIHYHAVSGATTGLPEGAIDLAYSNTVFEHLPPSQIAEIFDESYRILRPGGYMAHLIDLSDHFSHSDHSISTINFLQFSDESFAKYNSRFIFQNRLRASAWHQLIVQHGFKIVYWQTSVNERARRELPSLQLNKAFTNLSADELCTSSICLLAQRS